MKSPLYLLQLEWYKFGKNRLFLIGIIILFISIPGIYMGWNNLQISTDNPFFNKDSYLQFDKIWSLGAYFGNWLIFFIGGFLGIVTISSEMLYKTGRQQIISGLSRIDFLTGKFWVSTVMSLIFTLYYFLVTLITAYIATSEPGIFDMSVALVSCLKFFLMSMSYFIFGQLLAIVLRKNSLITMFLFFSYVMIIEPLLRWSIHFKLFENRSFLFYPMNVVEDLTPLPFIEPYKDLMENMSFTIFLTNQEAILWSLIYLSIYILLSVFVIRKANI